MLRFLLAPRWLVVHVAFTAAIAFCVVAGWWQFGVFEQNQTRHDERERSPAPISELVQPGRDIAAAADRPVTAQGTYLVEHRLVVHGRIHDGTLGWFVLVPFETDGGMIIPVVRGWVVESDDAGTLRASHTSVTGHLLPPEDPGNATVRSGQVLAEDELGHIAPQTVAAATGLSATDMVQGYVLLTDEEPAAGDVATLNIDEVAPIRNVNPWQNLSYWAQWWVFAIAGIVFWASAVRSGIRSRRPRTERHDSEQGGTEHSGTGHDGTEVSEPAPPRVPS